MESEKEDDEDEEALSEKLKRLTDDLEMLARQKKKVTRWLRDIERVDSKLKLKQRDVEKQRDAIKNKKHLVQERLQEIGEIPQQLKEKESKDEHTSESTIKEENRLRQAAEERRREADPMSLRQFDQTVHNQTAYTEAGTMVKNRNVKEWKQHFEDLSAGRETSFKTLPSTMCMTKTETTYENGTQSSPCMSFATTIKTMMDPQPPQKSGGAIPPQKKESEQQQAHVSVIHQHPTIANIGQNSQDTSTRQQAQVAAAETLWRQSIRVWYPDLHKKTYFLPPIQFNRVPYDVQSVVGLSALVPQKASDQPGQARSYFPPTGPPPHLSDPPLAAGLWPHYQPVPPGPLPVVKDHDVREDRAMQQVLDFIRVLAEREQQVMLVLSQLEFRKYLDNHVDPIYAAAILLLPRPATLAAGYEDGVFDVLMINFRYGLIVGEMKSVGADLSKIPDLDKAVLKAVEKAIKQLNRAKELLKHLVSDLACINITKTLMLPNVTSTQLSQALSTDPQVQQVLCDCLEAPDINSAVSRCLCKDGMEPSFTTSNDWWQRAVTDKGPDSSMTRHLYEVLVARFCGPATTIEIPTVTTPRRTVQMRTMSEAVALTGLTMAMLTLYPDQVDLVNRPGLSRVFLWGPPGTGKTVILVLKGTQWGHQGKDVHLLSTHKHSRAAIFLIERQLLHTPAVRFRAMPASGTHVHTATPASGTSGSRSLSEVLSRHTAKVGCTPTSASTSLPGARIYTHFYDFEHKGDVKIAVNKLASAACDGELFVIADEAFKGSDNAQTPTGPFAKFCNDLAARVPALHLWAAAVQRVVTHDCLDEQRLTHSVRCPPAVVTQVAKSKWIDDRRVPSYSSSAIPATTAGPRVKQIHHWTNCSNPTLSNGHTGDRPEDCEMCAELIVHQIGVLGVGKTDDLKYRDTIILCHKPRDNLPVVNNLQTKGLPVQVVTPTADEDVIRDVALAVRDAVIVTDYDVVCGLERRVVVVMGMTEGAGDYLDRLHAMSRCTSQLFCVGYPL